MSDLMDRFAEHENWVLKFDPVMEYWMVCTELGDRSGWRVIAHAKDPAEAIERALKEKSE